MTRNRYHTVSPEVKQHMAALWKKGRSLQEIADNLNRHLSMNMTKANVYYIASQNRQLFPKRPQKLINRLIADAMRGNTRDRKVKHDELEW